MATPPSPAGRNLSGGQIALFVLGALVLLLVLLWVFVLRGEPAVETVTPPVPAPGAASPTPEPEETTRPRNRPVETFEVFAPKDPFRPALAAALPGATNGTAGTTDGTATTSGGTDAAGGGVTSGGSVSSGGGGGSGSGQNIGGRRVRLVDVFSEGGAQRARVQVDGTVYTVAEGDRFADNFELLGIEGQCASLLYGDDQFTLCEGEEILK